MNDVPSQAEFGLLIAYLANNGMTQQAAQDVIGSNPNGRTRSQIASELRAWLKDRPKGG